MKGRIDPFTTALLLCGAISGPLFILLVLIQDYTVPGFNPRLMPLSLLSLGEYGWVQIANFVLAGALNLLYAVGLWRKLHPGPAGTMGPVSIALYGLGLITVGVNTTDPAQGFPPGVPAAPHPSGHGVIHALGALFVFVFLAIALLVFIRLFLARKERGWALYCLLSAVLVLVSFFGGINNPALMALTLRLGVLVGWMGPSMVAIRLLSAGDATRSTQEM